MGDLSPRLKWRQLHLIAHLCLVPRYGKRVVVSLCTIYTSVVMLKNGEPLRYVFPYGLLPTVPCSSHSVKEVRAGRWAELLNQCINLDLDVTTRHSYGRCPIHRVLRHGLSPFKRAGSQENVYWDPWARDGSRETRFFLTYAKFDSFSMYFCCRPMSVQYEDWEGWSLWGHDGLSVGKLWKTFCTSLPSLISRG